MSRAKALAIPALGRFHLGGFPAYLAIAGYVAAGTGIEFTTVVGLAGVALAVNHIAFAVNNLADLDVDRTDPKRQASPLVAGIIPASLAWWSCLGAALVALVCSMLFRIAGFSLQAPLVITALLLITGLVAFYQKRTNPFLMDFLYALLFAAGLALWPLVSSTWNTMSLSGLASVLLLALLMNMAGNLKDIATDYGSRFMTIAKALGVKPNRSGSIDFGSPFCIYALTLQLGFIIALFGWIMNSLVPLVPALGAVISGVLAWVALFALLRGDLSMNDRGLAHFVTLDTVAFLILQSAVIAKVSPVGLIIALVSLLAPLIIWLCMSSLARDGARE